ncbi:MAG: inositol-3-phosphate synthase [Planctomycetota bacterium]
MTSPHAGSDDRRRGPNPTGGARPAGEARPGGERRAAGDVGVWLVGARGSIATCLAYGLANLVEGQMEPTGLATEAPPVDRLDLAGFDQLVLGGHDVCRRDLSAAAAELVGARILTPELVAGGADRVARFEQRIRPGILDAADTGLADVDPRAAERGALSPRAAIAALRADWDAFEAETGVARTVVVYLASTEAAREPQAEWGDLAQLERALDEGAPQPASVLYAYAALGSGRPFVNFTPNRGAASPALRALAEARGVPHAGNDGKTGETLLKTVLGPMFVARALKVRAWQGYNMLGNRDGEVLREESHKASKLRTKDEALRSILGDSQDLTTKVAIDYVPSLHDWKTAYDFVHFEGFLGAQMSLQFTWQGSDSALAAPLVLDLVRLTEFAARRGERGVLAQTAMFFKAPLGGGKHDFQDQVARLYDYVERVLAQ